MDTCKTPASNTHHIIHTNWAGKVAQRLRMCTTQAPEDLTSWTLWPPEFTYVHATYRHTCRTLVKITVCRVATSLRSTSLMYFILILKMSL